MGFLSRLFKREDAQPPGEAPVSQLECLHGVLLPHWASLDDLGHEDRVESYSCEACNDTFSPEEGERLLAEEAERLRSANIERLRE